MTSRRRNLVILIAVLSVELVLLIYQLQQGKDLPLIRQVSIFVIAPIEKGIRTITDSTWTFWRTYVYLGGARQENEQLTRQLNALKLENQQLLTQAEQGKRLQRLLDFKEQLPSETIAAQVISTSGTDIARLLVLDKGYKAGLLPDMAVITPEGIVGKVLRVFRNASQVLLLTDASSGVAALFESSRIHGIVKGRNRPLCTVGYVLNGEKVDVGDRVLTSGEDQIYPKGLPIGVVVEKRPGVDFQEISVLPFAKLNRLEEVLVIVRKVDVELPALDEAGEAATDLQQGATGSVNGLDNPAKPGEAMPGARPSRPSPPAAGSPPVPATQ